MGASDVAFGELRTLFQIGTVGDVDDNQLLERFLARRDGGSEAAFAALVERHGPMVMGLCRRRLGDPHDAQDAFQATFLVLVRRAHSIRNQKSVASWLFGVACRVTSRAKRDEARRIAKLRCTAEMTGALKSVDDPLETWAELYEEIERLPDKYRLPIVLHYLENMTYEQIAQRVDCPLRTVQTRLARGRARLRIRLLRRGLAPEEGLSVAAQTKDALPAEHFVALAGKVARDASRFASGPLSSLASPKAASWTSGVLRTMIMTKLVSVSVVATVVGGIGVGAAVLAQQGSGGKPAADRASAESAPRPARNDLDQTIPASHAAKDRLIQEKLDEPITANFEEKPLEDLLKFIKKCSTGANDNGIPIYVEPNGLAEVGQTMTSPVTTVVNGVKVRSVLEMALRPLGLAFTVKDGLLIIDSRSSITLLHLENRLNSLEAKLDRILKAVERSDKAPGR